MCHRGKRGRNHNEVNPESFLSNFRGSLHNDDAHFQQSATTADPLLFYNIFLSVYYIDTLLQFILGFPFKVKYILLAVFI